MSQDVLSALQNKNLLFDFYGALLTDRQRDIYAMSNLEDCSFTEISKELDITPQAVADNVKRATTQLGKYEQSLGMVEKLLSQKQIIKKIEMQLAELDKLGWTEISEKVSNIKGLMDKLLI